MRKFLCGYPVLCSLIEAFARIDSELVVWINGDKGYDGLTEVGRRFEKDVGIKLTVEHPEGLTDKFQAAAQSDKGPDIMLWTHDRIGEWVDAGLLRPIYVSDDFKRKFIPMSWDLVTYKQQLYGYPLALETVSLIYNKKYVNSASPGNLADLPAFAKELKSKYPDVTAIMWDYKTPYFSWPFLASAGAYAFKKTQSGYDTNDTGVDTSGAVEALKEIVDVIDAGVLPKDASYSVMVQKMNAGDLATMISGPWAWANLRRSGIEFGLAPVPGVNGHAGRPFVGVLTALINRSTPRSELAAQFIENYVLTNDGLKSINADVPIGVPALETAYGEFATQDPLIMTIYEDARSGEPMPNVRQMRKFWSAMEAALHMATNGQSSPRAALARAREEITKAI
jgi:maltose/maltodextrin transport system substrate-binding protein